MKKYLTVLFFLLFFLQACEGKPDNITFTAEVESADEGSMLVTTTDDVGFDRASVFYDGDMELSFTPYEGQRVEITILPEIRESYPVQVTAVEIRPLTAEYRKITPEGAKEAIDAGGAVILDVRTKEEYDAGHIPGAVLLPDDEIKQRAAEVLPDRNAVILVYCRSGNRSESASRELIGMGYTDVRDFGGIIDWPYEY